MAIKAIIYDNDGTLSNSEEMSVGCWIEAGNHYGLNVTRHSIECLRGCSPSSAKPIFEKEYGLKPGWDVVKKYRDSIFFKMVYEKGIPLLKGARDALEATRELGYKCVLATSAGPSYCVHFLSVNKIFNLFDVKAYGSMVKFGKPDPAIYNLVTKRLGLKPEECLVVEDAPNGVISAKAAGCKVCAVPGVKFKKEILDQCDYVLHDLTEMRKLLKKLKEEK